MRFNARLIEEEFNIMLTNVAYTPPEAKIVLQEVPGRAVPLDLTEYFGEINYSNGNLSLEFSTLENKDNFKNITDELLKRYQGQDTEITVEKTDTSYYKGRLKISPKIVDKGIQTVTVTSSTEPYRYKLNPTVVDVQGSASEQTVILNNWQKKVAPIVSTTTEATIKIGEQTFTLGIGTYSLGYQLNEGENTLLVTSAGDLTFTYQERGL